jgi:hypothetical protein
MRKSVSAFDVYARPVHDSSRVLEEMEWQREHRYRLQCEKEIEKKMQACQSSLLDELAMYDSISQQVTTEFRQLMRKNCSVEYDSLAERPEIIPSDLGLSYRSLLSLPEESLPPPQPPEKEDQDIKELL